MSSVWSQTLPFSVSGVAVVVGPVLGHRLICGQLMRLLLKLSVAARFTATKLVG